MSNIDSLAETLSKLNIIENSETTTNSLNNLKMTTINAAKEIAHTLRPFSGRSEHLEYFINSVDTFYNRYALNTTDESLKEFVFASITAKIIDEAGDFLLCRPDLKTWPDIKNALRLKFGDKTDRHVLLQQLNFLCRNKNETSLEFIDRLKQLLAKISVKTQSDINLTAATKTALIQQAESTAITVLLANIPSELRTILMIRNPKSLDDANSLVFNHSLIEQQINSRSNITRFTPIQTPVNSSNNIFQQHKTNTMPHFSNFKQNHFMPPKPQNFHTPNFVPRPNLFNQNFNANFSPTPRFPSQPINIQPRPINPNYLTNRQVFGKPKNVFSPENSHKPTDKPTPMSTTSKIPSLQTRNFGQRENPFMRNPHRSPYRFTELTNVNDGYSTNETYPDNPVYYNHDDQYYNNYNENPSYNEPELYYTGNENSYYTSQYQVENTIEPDIVYNENSSLQETENFQVPASEKNQSQM